MLKQAQGLLAQGVAFLFRSDGSLKDKVLRSGIWQTSISLTINSLTFLRSIILARLLPPEAFGLMGMTLIVIRGVEVFTTTGFAPALIQRKGGFDEAAPTAFSLLTIRGVVIALLMIPMAFGMAEFFDEPALEAMIAVTGASFVFTGLSNIQVVGRHRELDFRLVAYMEQATAILSFVVTIAVAYWIRSAWALVVGFVIAAVFKFVFSYLFIPGKPRFEMDRKIAKELFAYGKFVAGANILFYTASQIDSMAIGKLMDAEQLGYYVIAFTLANYPPLHIALVTSNVLGPAYSKLQDDQPKLRHMVHRVQNAVSSIVLPISLGFYICSEEIITVLFGEKWLATIRPFEILCLFGALHAFVALNGYLFNAIGHPHASFRLAVWRVVLVAGSIIPLTIDYGLYGAAISVTFPMAVTLILGYWTVSKLLGESAINSYKSIFPGILKAVLIGAALWGTRRVVDGTEIGGFAILVSVAGILYVVLNLKLVLSVFRSGKK